MLKIKVFVWLTVNCANELFHKGSSKGSDQVFSYLLQFLGVLRTHLSIKHSSRSLVILEQRNTTNIFIKNTGQIQKSKVSVFNAFLRIHMLSMLVFNQSIRSSWKI